MARLRLRPRAVKDLEEIGDFIATDNPTAAIALIEDIMRSCGLLAASPRLGRDRSMLRPQTRSFSIGRYVIYYSPVSDGIEVIRVLHGAGDVQSL